MPELFGDKLRFLRHQHNLTQAKLAERLGLASHSHISNLEANQDAPSLVLVLHVADLFGVTTDYLLHDTIPVEGTTTALAGDLPGVDAPPGLFGAKLRALRHQHRLTQAALADQLGLAQQGYVSNLELSRKVPSLDLVVQIADLFGVTTDYLLRDTIPVEHTAFPSDQEPL